MNRKQLLTTIVTITILLAVAGVATGQKPAAQPEDPNALDINSAPPEKLMTLPNIDLMTAKKIIAARPYKNKEELTKKKIVSEEQYKGIVSKITAKQADAPKK